MPFGIGQWELIVLGVVVLLIFGSSRLPKIGRDLGRSLREMKETVEDIDPRKPIKELERPAERDDVRDSGTPRT
jgi:sec-independent protein translocase protein TatA